jgi:hypothetical protein
MGPPVGGSQPFFGWQEVETGCPASPFQWLLHYQHLYRMRFTGYLNSPVVKIIDDGII